MRLVAIGTNRGKVNFFNYLNKAFHWSTSGLYTLKLFVDMVVHLW